MRILLIASALMTIAPIAAADARPGLHGGHGHHRVCRTVFEHHHRVQRCR